MYDEDSYEIDRRDGRVASQLPPVLVAVVAITLIVLVNSGVYPPAALSTPSGEAARSLAPAVEAVQPAVKPAATTGGAAAPLAPGGSGRA